MAAGRFFTFEDRSFNQWLDDHTVQVIRPQAHLADLVEPICASSLQLPHHFKIVTERRLLESVDPNRVKYDIMHCVNSIKSRELLSIQSHMAKCCYTLYEFDC